VSCIAKVIKDIARKVERVKGKHRTGLMLFLTVRALQRTIHERKLSIPLSALKVEV
jgi:hypothetical protein